jgi:hypothetical protein
MKTSDVIEQTHAYEEWLAAAIPVVATDLVAKHAQMAGSIVRFLRGSYYLWLDHMFTLLPDLMTAPAVPAIGDLHIENFGTWRDLNRVQRWGVNDFDDAGRASYAIDLVRLATSAAVAPHLALEAGDVCDVLMDEWLSARPGPAADLGDSRTHELSHLVPPAADANDFFAHLAKTPALPEPPVPASVVEAVNATAPSGWSPSWHPRIAGTGSLGHPRFAAVGPDAVGTPHARETKLLGPPTAAWIGETRATTAGIPIQDPSVFTGALTSLPGPRHQGRLDSWQYRGLSPRDRRIELSSLGKRDSQRLLRFMAQAVVNVHGLDPVALAAARDDSARRPSKWFPRAVQQMANDCRASFRRFGAEYGR